MAIGTEYIPLFLDFNETTQDLSDEECGQLVRAIVDYANDDDYESRLTGGAKIAFRFLKGIVDRNVAISEKRSKARTNKDKTEQNETNENKSEQNGTNENKTEQNETKPNKTEQNETKSATNTKTNTETNTETKKETKTKTKTNDSFDRFWTAYPRHDSKENARKAFDKLNPDDSLMDTILLAIARQKESQQWQENGGQFIPYPASWLNGKRWQDEVKPRPTGTGKPVQAQDYEQREYGGTTDDARKRMLAMLDGEIDV